MAYHWKKLLEYKEHMDNPSNSRSSMGFRYTSLPFDNTPHLEALVAAGEIQKRSILIPGLPVSRENTKEWMEFASDPEVLEARSQGDCYSGEVPFSFTIWYRPTFEERIEEFIEELNKRAKSVGAIR